MVTILLFHQDFYPNGGREQPGCGAQIGCNHLRSIVLFTESINTKCPFMSITCESYEAFKKGKCAQCNRDGNHCIRFGFHSRADYKKLVKRAGKGQFDGSPVATYFLTSEKEPFCAAHYKVTVKVSGKIDRASLITKYLLLDMNLKHFLSSYWNLRFISLHTRNK